MFVRTSESSPKKRMLKMLSEWLFSLVPSNIYILKRLIDEKQKKNFGQIGPEFCARFSQPVSSKILKVESVERLY